MSTSAESTPATGTARCPVDLMDPALLGDPFQGYSRIREQSRVAEASFPGVPQKFHLVTRYDDVRAVLSDPRFVNNPASVPGSAPPNYRVAALTSRGVPEAYLPYFAASILDNDGDDHTRLRKLVSRTFTVRRVNELRPRVEEITERLLDDLPRHAEDGAVDLVEHFAYPLPITVICELVGVPKRYRPQWRDWGNRLVSFDPDADFGSAVVEMVDHIHELIRERRAAAAEDLLTGLIRTHDEDGDRLSDQELVTMVLTLVIAGHETTAHLIGNGTFALLTHPDQLARLRAEPGLAPRAVHELMRWCGPLVQAPRARYATEDVTIGDTTFHRGDLVLPMLASANYDPREFDDPERLDITREPAGRRETHVGFSHGPHYCLGAALARQEGEVAFTALLRRYPDLALASGPADAERRLMPAMWRLSRLPVRL
ncbi:cytochrome P450 [Nocardiopsis sediminis]|uniref:Cytochrome P450 n=1 Tax=Nocardiopsis sediminis TaxID=1778267 RepID=A0ABV8FL18_9ACTN